MSEFVISENYRRCSLEQNWSCGLLFLDAETGVLPELEEEAKADPEMAKRLAEKGALCPSMSDPLVIGLTDSLGNYVGISGGTVEERLTFFWELMPQNPRDMPLIVGANHERFDFSYLVGASLLKKVAFPDCYYVNNKWGDRHICTLDIQQFLRQGGNMSMPLDLAARRMGLPGKTGNFGKNFGILWKSESMRPTLIEYNRMDNVNAAGLTLLSGAVGTTLRLIKENGRGKCMPRGEPFVLPSHAVTWMEGKGYIQTMAKAVPKRVEPEVISFRQTQMSLGPNESGPVSMEAPAPALKKSGSVVSACKDKACEVAVAAPIAVQHKPVKKTIPWKALSVMAQAPAPRAATSSVRVPIR